MGHLFESKTWCVRFGVNESTKKLPFFLLFNREVIVPIDNLLKPRRKYQGEDPHKIALEQEHKVFLLVRQNSRMSMKKGNNLINSKAKDVIFKVGDAIYYRSHNRKSKLDAKWKLFCRIIKQTSLVTFVIKDSMRRLNSKSLHPTASTCQT